MQENNVDDMQNFLKENNVELPAPTTNDKPSKKQKKLQEKMEKAMKPISENQVGRVAQGKIISDVAKAEGVEFSPALEQGLKNGSKKAVETAQAKLQDAGIFDNETTQSNLDPVSQQQQNFTPQENKTTPKAQFADSPELNPYKEKISELTNEFNDIQRQLTDAYNENSKVMNNGDTQTMQRAMTRINNLNQQSLNKQTEIQTAQEELRKAREKVSAQTQNSNAQFDAVQNQTKEILKQIQSTPEKSEVTPAEENTQKKVYKINQKQEPTIQQAIKTALKSTPASQKGKIAQGKALLQVAKANGVELDSTLESGVKQGLAKALQIKLQKSKKILLKRKPQNNLKHRQNKLPKLTANKKILLIRRTKIKKRLKKTKILLSK